MIKLKAGALQFTIFVIVIVGILLATFIIFIYTHNQFHNQSELLVKTIKNADKGVDYLLHNLIDLKYSEPFNLEAENEELISITTDFWGVYKKVISTSSIKQNTFNKVALLGFKRSDKDVALYVEDHNRPLVVVGDTKIIGDAFIPEQGIRTGNISGNSYYGSQLIYGRSRTIKDFPNLNTEILNQIKHIKDRIKDLDNGYYLDVEGRRVIEKSFLEPLKAIYKPDVIKLTEISLTGHIVVQSETKIKIDASATLHDVILIAPQVEIGDNVKGNFQVFASKSLKVGTACNLTYPSVLVLNEEIKISETSNNETPVLEIGEGTEVKGSVIFLGESKGYKAQTIIDKNTIITGEVYCNRNLELKGIVEGVVLTSSFVANQSGSSYQNHLYNGIIDINKLHDNYVGITFKDEKRGIVKWLY
ncbi:hypothetical protein NO995_07465 [Aestuariibaculum sp. M13]|uniref:hypothetical protein n=1 Tax=unclassified Aestuariibaculum TaxID=2646735 RepID=UPI002159EF6C|nr:MULTISPECIES: hypothetical protein [unclassified Aestuariibaculum]MCR8667513.1 hypothetical protein [Aestuariibaculum sp. M13]WMI65251.1 hypothetical protein RBH94_14440 [Aestuariibaculum sp. YM273]